jgi:hypothetical protein
LLQEVRLELAGLPVSSWRQTASRSLRPSGKTATPAIVPLPYIASIHVCDFAANCLVRTLEIELKPWKIPQVMVRCGGIKTAAAALYSRTYGEGRGFSRMAAPGLGGFYPEKEVLIGRRIGTRIPEKSELSRQSQPGLRG